MPLDPIQYLELSSLKCVYTPEINYSMTCVELGGFFQLACINPMVVQKLRLLVVFC